MAKLGVLFVALAFVAIFNGHLWEAVAYLVAAVALFVLHMRGWYYRPRWERRIRSGKDRPW